MYIVKVKFVPAILNELYNVFFMGNQGHIFCVKFLGVPFFKGGHNILRFIIQP